MASTQVTPTRMELTRTKKKEETGHSHKRSQTSER